MKLLDEKIKDTSRKLLETIIKNDDSNISQSNNFINK